MNPEIKAQWVAALESGDYKQGTWALRFKDRYCCLGVLCDLASKAGVVEENERDSGYYSYGVYGEESTLPAEVTEWSGLTSPDPRVREYSLVELNDAQKANFVEIAAKIKEHL